MKFTSHCLSSVVFLMYFSVVVLVVIANGQAATDDKDEMIVQLREELAKSVGRIGKLEDLLAASVDIIAELNGRLASTSGNTCKPDASKFNSPCLR